MNKEKLIPIIILIFSVICSCIMCALGYYFVVFVDFDSEDSISEINVETQQILSEGAIIELANEFVDKEYPDLVLDEPYILEHDVDDTFLNEIYKFRLGANFPDNPIWVGYHVTDITTSPDIGVVVVLIDKDTGEVLGAHTTD